MFDEILIECPKGHTRQFHQHHNGSRRLLRQINECDIKRSGWLDSDAPLPNGLYCASCDDGVRLALDDAEITSFGLDDYLLDVPAHETAAAEIAKHVRTVIGDAEFAVHTEPARKAVFGPEPTGLHPRVRCCFPTHLYVHQSEAITAALAGHDVVQTTGTGSGKSVGMWAPVLSALATDPNATAVAVLPLKALGNDQIDFLASLSEEKVTDTSLFNISLGGELSPIEVGIMNGDRSASYANVLKKARLIVTTPDQLHMRILPNMRKSNRFVAGLRFVILDEIHTYTGQNGSTMASLMQRLQIDCLHTSGSTPQFLMSSASLANVDEFSQRLTGRTNAITVSTDGSPKPEFTTFVVEAAHRDFIPALHTEIARGFQGAPPAGLTFVQSKEGVKILAEESRKTLEGEGFSAAANSVIAYSAQDDAGSRVDKEGKIANDEARFVLTTSALELGVDFPNMHYSVTTEFAGLVMETRQRLGRAGRRHPGVGVVLIESRKQPSWPMTPAGALETIRFAPAAIQAPVVTANHRENVLVIGLAHDLTEIDLDLVRRVDPALAVQVASSEYWQESSDTTAVPMCFEKLAPFRGSTEKGTVLISRGNKILTNWNGPDLVKNAWCGNRLTMDDGRQYEVVAIKRQGYGDGNWEIRVELADDVLEVDSAVFSQVIDEVVSSTEKFGHLTFTRSEAKLKHSLSTSRRRQPGEEWVSHQASRRVNQVISQRTAVTSIRLNNRADHIHADTIRLLVMACLDAIGVSQYEIWSSYESGRILFYDPQGRTSPIAWSIVDRLDELTRVAEERIIRLGHLLVEGRRIEQDDLFAALHLLAGGDMRKAA